MLGVFPWSIVHTRIEYHFYNSFKTRGLPLHDQHLLYFVRSSVVVLLKMSSPNERSYADAAANRSPEESVDDPHWWYRSYQKENEEQALLKAIQLSEVQYDRLYFFRPSKFHIMTIR